MRNGFLFFLGYRYVLAGKQSHLVSFISKISIAGLVLAVSLLVLASSVMNGFDAALRDKILGVTPHLILTGDQEVTQAQWPSIVAIANAHPGVAQALPYSYLRAMLVSQANIKPVLLYGMDQQTINLDASIDGLFDDAFLATFAETKTICLGQPLAEKLGVQVGDTLQVLIGNQQRADQPRVEYFEVSSLLNTGTELDQQLAVTHRQWIAALRHYKPDSVNGIRIQVHDLFAVPDIAYTLRAQTGLTRVSHWMNSHGNLYQAVQMSRRLVLFLVCIIIAVAVFNVASTLVLTVHDKQSDIAILITLGCSKQQIIRLFLWQGFLIGVIGTSIGVLLGMALSISVSDVFAWFQGATGIQLLSTDVYPIDYVPSDIRLQDVTLIASMSLLLSIFTGAVPASWAASIKPAKVLRYK